MRVRLAFSTSTGTPLVVRLDRHSDFTTFYEVIVEGCYDDLLRIMGPGDVVVDAGANIGLFTLLASVRVGPTGRVLAVEPDPENFSRLDECIRENRISNVDLFALALEEVSGDRRFLEGSGNTARVVTQPSAQGATPVSTITVDEISRREKRQPTVVKIDVEGSEAGVFRGLSETLASVRALVVEVENADSASVIASSLSQFRISPIRTPGLRRYLVTALHRPLLLPALELNNRFRSVLRLARRGFSPRALVRGYPENWLAERQPRSGATTR